MRDFGFRELESFNNTLLGKMVARIMSESNALWVKVLKGLYFPSTNFMKAIKGGRASWCWTSILTGHDVVQSVGVWSKGDGKTIRAFSDL